MTTQAAQSNARYTANAAWSNVDSKFASVEDFIAKGEANAWPLAVRFEKLCTSTGLAVPGKKAVVADYASGKSAVVGTAGGFYRATQPSEWRDLCRAAVAAGATPSGVFQLKGGSRIMATFDVGGNGIRTQLLLADSFDGTLKLTCGTTSIRLFCLNQMAAVMKQDGEGMARLSHTAALETKINVLRETIGETIKTGEKVRKLYHAAEETRLSRPLADAIFDKLFPEAEEGASKFAKTKAENARNEARLAAALPINDAGPTLATLWNAATYVVDRDADGHSKARGDSDVLDSMLFGARAQRVQEIQHTIEVVMASGEIERMSVSRAMDHGVDARQIGRAILDEILA